MLVSSFLKLPSMIILFSDLLPEDIAKESSIQKILKKDIWSDIMTTSLLEHKLDNKMAIDVTEKHFVFLILLLLFFAYDISIVIKQIQISPDFFIP